VLSSSSNKDGGGGQIYIALCANQGGSSATTQNEWKQSWQVTKYASYHGLILQQLYNASDFVSSYDLSSHRGVDRSFSVGDAPELYVFGFPNNENGSSRVEKRYQLCCRHELHILLPNKDKDNMNEEQQQMVEDVIYGDAIYNIIQNIVPKGIRVEIPLKRLVTIYPPTTTTTSNSSKKDDNNNDETSSDTTARNAIAFMVVYCSETTPMTRKDGDTFRSKLEDEISKIYSDGGGGSSSGIELRHDRMGRQVSHLFPYQTFVPEDLLWFSKHPIVKG